MLVLTQPHIIEEIHTVRTDTGHTEHPDCGTRARASFVSPISILDPFHPAPHPCPRAQQYFEAGSDIVETNTFNATTISQADYHLEHIVYEMNKAAAQVAKRAAAKVEASPNWDGRRRLVAGAVGPTSRTLSVSPSVEDPGFRNVTFDELKDAYRQQCDALIDGGVDLFLVETIFDTLNAKAALFAIDELFEARPDKKCPIFISGTIVDLSGRTLSGQTTEAFYVSMAHAKPMCIGLNCALGAQQMRPFLQRLGQIAECFVSAYPNAGLPNAMGGYDESPADMAPQIAEFARDGLLNMIGGCCGTTPPHIRAIADAMKGIRPRQVPAKCPYMRLSGLEALTISPDKRFVNVGERCNIAGSLAFKKLILAGDYDKALAIARKQVEDGAQVIDINLDDVRFKGGEWGRVR